MYLFIYYDFNPNQLSVRSQYKVLTTQTMLRDGGSGVSIPLGLRFLFFSSPENADRLCGPHSLLFSGYCGKAAGGMEFTTHFHLATRRMSGALPLLPLYTFAAWTGNALHFTLYKLLFSFDFYVKSRHSLFVKYSFSI